MSLNLVKLCVGAESLESFQDWAGERLRQMQEAGGEVQLFHTTRMVPRRMDELLDGGSLYWVIKGNIQARQALVDIRPFTDDQGIGRCKLMLDNEIIATQWQPKRAFQGWRYLEQRYAPGDMNEGEAGLPPTLRADLAELGLL